MFALEGCKLGSLVIVKRSIQIGMWNVVVAKETRSWPACTHSTVI